MRGENSVVYGDGATWLMALTDAATLVRLSLTYVSG